MSISKALIIACSTFTLCAQNNPQLYLLDQIEFALFVPEGTQIITTSDLARPSLEGKPRIPEQMITDRLMYLDAKKYNMWPDADMIDKHLDSIKRDNNLSQEDLLNIFTTSGYTYDEAREEFAIMYANSSVAELKIRSRLLVPEKDVIAYYEAHPIYDDASYEIERAVVPFDRSKTRDAQRADIEQSIRAGAVKLFDWSTPFWLADEDIAPDKAFIKTMNVRSISQPQEIASGFELYHLLDKKEKRLRTLEERYREIVNTLRQPKYIQLFNDYKKSLWDNASIVEFRAEQGA